MTEPSMLDAIQFVAIVFVAVLLVFGAAGWLWDKAVARYVRRRNQKRWAARVLPITPRKKHDDYPRPRGAA